LNKKILILSPLIFSIGFSVVISIFLSNVQISSESQMESTIFFSKAGQVVRDIEEIDRHIIDFSDLHGDSFWKESLLKTTSYLKDDMSVIQAESDEQIAKRIEHFIKRIEHGTEQLLNEEDPPEKRGAAFLKLKTDIWKIRDIVEHAVKKKKIQKQFEEKKNIKRTEKLTTYTLLMFILLMVFTTAAAMYFYNKLSKLNSLLGSGGNVDVKRISELIEKAKNSSADQFSEIQKKYMREQIVNKRKGALLDTIPEGIFSSDQSDRITFVNRKFLEWFHIEENIIGDDAGKIFSAMNVARDGEKFIFEGNVFVLSSFENSGETFYIIRNITDSEELARKLLDSERLVSIGEMASRITHEIRNPLSTIKLNSEYLAENVDELESSQISGSINLIVKEVERLEQITGKYMNMVKYRNAEETEKNTSLPVDLAEVISFHAAEFEKRGIEVKLIHCENIVIPITLSSFKEVMLNLFKNGWEELENGGKILITVSVKNDRCVIVVEDSGKGIPEIEREQVFRNFYTKKPGGTGIGLSHSRKLAVEAGGKLYAADSSLGGVAMVLEIPLKTK